MIDLRKLFQRHAITDVVTALERGQIVHKCCGTLNVSWLITNPGDEIQSAQLLDGFYEADTLSRVCASIPRAKYIFDFGANIGNHSVYFQKHFKPNRIVPVEPFHPAIQHLMINLALNYSPCFDFSFLGYGVSEATGKADIHPPSRFNIGLTRLSSSPSGPVPLLSGDEIVAGSPADLIKIDVEGMELSVLRGLTGTLHKQRPSLFVEVMDRHRNEIDSFLSAHSYTNSYEDRKYEGMANCLYLA